MTGNFCPSIWDEGLTYIKTAFLSDNTVVINLLFYALPVGVQQTVTAGPLICMDDAEMMGGYTTEYPSNQLLDFFTYTSGPSDTNLAG